jgi:phosphoesterase RecJ-like protein
MEQIIRQLMNSSKVLLATHINPDGDAIGSLIASGLLLEKLGKQTTLLIESPIPAVYRFLPAMERIVDHPGTEQDFDTAVVLDCGDLLRVGEAHALIQRLPVVINIDHHITNTGFGQMSLIDTEACATAEIIYRIIKAMDIPIDKAMATSLYTGILTDTGSFRFSNTNPMAFAISREMTDLGVKPYEVAQHVYGTYSLGRIKLLNRALDSIELAYDGKLSLMTVTHSMLAETGTQPEDVDGFINYARRIEDVKVAALIHEYDNGSSRAGGNRLFHVSLRSDGSIDVAGIASHFGGGGHHTAAGFEIEATLVEVKAQIVELLERL